MPTPLNFSTLKSLEGDLNQVYTETLVSVKPRLSALIQPHPVPNKVLHNEFLAGMPPLRRMFGARNHRPAMILGDSNGNANVFKVCEKFESTVDVPRDLFLGDKGTKDVFATAVANAARRSNQHVDRQASRALLNGTTSHAQYIGIDNGPIFSKTHTFANGANTAQQSNLLTGALSIDNFMVALETANAWADNEGNQLDVGYDPANTWLVVPPQLRETAWQVLEGAGLAANLTLPGISSNAAYGQAHTIIAPYLKREAQNWYVLFGVGGVAPITHAEFIPPEMTVRMDPSDPIVYETDTYSFGLFAQTHTFILPWWQALKSESVDGNSLYTGNNILVDF